MNKKSGNWGWSFLIAIGFLSVLCGSLWSLKGFIDSEDGYLIRLDGVLYLILSMGAISMSGRLLFRANEAWLLCFISLPMGLFWSANEFMTTLAFMADPSHLPYSATDIILPIFVSGLVCALTFFLMGENEESGIESDVTLPKLCGFTSIPLVVFLVLYTFGFWFPDLLFADILVFLIVFGCLAMGLARNGRNSEKHIRDFDAADYGFSFLDGGKVATFVGAAVVTVFYVALSRLDDPKALGPLLALGLCSLAWGTFIYLIGIMISSVVSSPENKRNLHLDAWHIAEAYAFVILAVFAPMSIFEM